MKKHFLLLLMTLLPLAGFAQMAVGDQFMDDSYVYEVTKAPFGATFGEVKVLAVLKGANPVSAEGVLTLPGQVSTTAYGETYKFNVRYAETNALQNFGTTNGSSLSFKGEFTGKTTATSVVIPKEWSKILSGCFNGFTNIKEISFEANSVVSEIADQAFATTQISTFDFSNCIRLQTLSNGIFVEGAGAVNSYITTIKLPAKSTVLKDINSAFMNLTNLSKIENLENSAIQTVVAGAFLNDAKLTSLVLPGTVKTIAAGAFENSGIKTLTIDVTSITTIGDGTNNVYGTSTANKQKLETLVLKGNLGGVVTTGAFKDFTKLKTLTLDDLSFVSGGQFATSSFEGCTNIATVSIKAINDTPTTGYTIDADAFKGCTKLTTVKIGGINSAQAVGAKAFGEKLTNVTIGTVKAGAASLATQAFYFDNVKGTSLNLATGTDEYLSSDDAITAIIAAGAFDFTGVTGGTGWTIANFPTVNIGRIRSVGGVFAQGAIKGNNIYALNFKGNIASNGIDKCPISDNTAATSVANLKLNKLYFDGKIATGGIATNAFANLPNAMELYFKGDLSEKAIALGGFEDLKAGSSIDYSCTTLADEYVNAFDQKAFSATAVFGTARDIEITVANTQLNSNYHGNFDGSGIAIADGDFDIYRVKFYVAPVPVVVDKNFVAYRNQNEKNVAWARLYQLGAKGVGTIADGTSLEIKRVQNLDGGKVKVTLYGTYTDEDDDLNASTIYMVPLRVVNGVYQIQGTNTETIIAKVEKKDADITDANKDLKVAVKDIAGVTNDSWWGGLTNTELKVAQNIMTNQQLVDNTAKDGGALVDIYRGTYGTSTAKIWEDLYIMSDPSKYNGFYISKNQITKTNNAYINTEWYYMLLKHYDGAPAAARVIWMSEDDAADAIFDVKAEGVKTVAEGWYTIDGKKLNAAPTQRGMYIKNGKKIVVK